MSAYKKCLAALSDEPYTPFEGSPKELLDNALAEHAHELAEKIRAESRSRPYYPEHDITGTQAANLIDPEIT